MSWQWALVFIAAGFLAGGATIKECGPQYVPGEVRIETNTIVQIRTQARIVRVPTNPAEMAALVDELNGYRTGPGWIAASNRRVWAGLQARAWAADYAVDTIPVLWQVGLWAGYGGAGAYVSRKVGPVRLGVLAGYGVLAGSIGLDW